VGELALQEAAERADGAKAEPAGVTELKVRFHELDPNGHVNHSVYLGYLETARIELLESLGFTPMSLAERGVHLVIVEVDIRFRRPAIAGDLLTIETGIRELKRASSWWHQRITRDGAVIAEADVRSTATDRDGRLTRPPADLLDALHSHLVHSS
jgi:YbgC/YbaW family acyl-CoA thioester hydrolase